ncbi:hypothetical protein ANN_10918 [Periplaneta americana]|uniref:Uncharacterized protein n=1 Tax=Periplaneta americana TaxID=6978 RepID=A0ABQ8T499_PERAM|nr:hypothetical protein ANN_10918 [Periplaneta americana]
MLTQHPIDHAVTSGKVLGRCLNTSALRCPHRKNCRVQGLVIVLARGRRHVKKLNVRETSVSGLGEKSDLCERWLRPAETIPAGWDGVYFAIANEEDCRAPDHELGYPGNCGSRALGIAYLVSYLIITCLVVINMYAAVILDYVLEIPPYRTVAVDSTNSFGDDKNNSNLRAAFVKGNQKFDLLCLKKQLSAYVRDFLNIRLRNRWIGRIEDVYEDSKEGLTDDDYDMFFEVWQQFDPEATQYIRYDQLSELLEALQPPLQVQKPNKYKILSMNIPICKDDHIFYKDVLEALVKDVFSRRGSPVEAGDVQVPNVDEAEYKPVSSTLQRQREEYCVRLIQNAWRKHKQQN